MAARMSGSWRVAVLTVLLLTVALLPATPVDANHEDLFSSTTTKRDVLRAVSAISSVLSTVSRSKIPARYSTNTVVKLIDSAVDSGAVDAAKKAAQKQLKKSLRKRQIQGQVMRGIIQDMYGEDVGTIVEIAYCWQKWAGGAKPDAKKIAERTAGQLLYRSESEADSASDSAKSFSGLPDFTCLDEPEWLSYPWYANFAWHVRSLNATQRTCLKTELARERGVFNSDDLLTLDEWLYAYESSGGRIHLIHELLKAFVFDHSADEKKTNATSSKPSNGKGNPMIKRFTGGMTQLVEKVKTKYYENICGPQEEDKTGKAPEIKDPGLGESNSLVRKALKSANDLEKVRSIMRKVELPLKKLGPTKPVARAAGVMQRTLAKPVKLLQTVAKTLNGQCSKVGKTLWLYKKLQDVKQKIGNSIELAEKSLLPIADKVMSAAGEEEWQLLAERHGSKCGITPQGPDPPATSTGPNGRRLHANGASGYSILNDCPGTKILHDSVIAYADFLEAGVMAPINALYNVVQEVIGIFEGPIKAFVEAANKVLDAMQDAFEEVSSILDLLESIVSAIDWIPECPSWLSFICDFDQLLVEAIDAVLSAIPKVPTLSELEDFVVKQILGLLKIDLLDSIFQIPDDLLSGLPFNYLLEGFEQVAEVLTCVETFFTDSGIYLSDPMPKFSDILGRSVDCSKVLSLGLNLPGFPNINLIPNLPDLPNVPVPSLPSLPSIPPLPPLPSIPGLPSLPRLMLTFNVTWHLKLLADVQVCIAEAQVEIAGGVTVDADISLGQPDNTKIKESEVVYQTLAYANEEPVFRCKTGTVPVVKLATYTCSRMDCDKDLTGDLRFPCGLVGNNRPDSTKVLHANATHYTCTSCKDIATCSHRNLTGNCCTPGVFADPFFPTMPSYPSMRLVVDYICSSNTDALKFMPALQKKEGVTSAAVKEQLSFNQFHPVSGQRYLDVDNAVARSAVIEYDSFGRPSNRLSSCQPTAAIKVDWLSKPEPCIPRGVLQRPPSPTGWSLNTFSYDNRHFCGYMLASPKLGRYTCPPETIDKWSNKYGDQQSLSEADVNALRNTWLHHGMCTRVYIPHQNPLLSAGRYYSTLKASCSYPFVDSIEELDLTVGCVRANGAVSNSTKGKMQLNFDSFLEHSAFVPPGLITQANIGGVHVRVNLMYDLYTDPDNPQYNGWSDRMPLSMALDEQWERLRFDTAICSDSLNCALCSKSLEHVYVSTSTGPYPVSSMKFIDYMDRRYAAYKPTNKAICGDRANVNSLCGTSVGIGYYDIAPVIARANMPSRYPTGRDVFGGAGDWLPFDECNQLDYMVRWQGLRRYTDSTDPFIRDTITTATERQRSAVNTYLKEYDRLVKKCGESAWRYTSYKAIPGPTANNFYGSSQWNLAAVDEECQAAYTAVSYACVAPTSAESVLFAEYLFTASNKANNYIAPKCLSMAVPDTLEKFSVRVIKAEAGIGFNAHDITEYVQDYCSDVGRYSCIMFLSDMGNFLHQAYSNVSTVEGKEKMLELFANNNPESKEPAKAVVMSVVYTCTCPSGYEPDMRYDANTTKEYYCTPCGVGYVRQSDVDAACVACPAGTISNGDRTACLPCTGNLYTSSPAQVACEVCPSGFVGNADNTGCDMCPINTARKQNDVQGPCNPCAAGYFAYQVSSPTVHNTFGFVPQPIAAADCTACPIGYFRSAGMEQCTPCPPGTWSNTTGAETCKPCEPGFFARGQGNTVCSPCPVGFFCSGVADPFGGGGITVGRRRRLLSISTVPKQGSLVLEQGNLGFAPGDTFNLAPGDSFNLAPGDAFNLAPGNTVILPPGDTFTLEPGTTFTVMEQGNVVPDMCPFGTGTTFPGASSLADCQPSLDIDFDALVDPSCYANPDACMDLTDTTPASGSSAFGFGGPVKIRSCYQMYAYVSSLGYLPFATAGGKPYDYYGFVRQVNNSRCNLGPWNTLVCQYDGGDCCCSTCKRQPEVDDDGPSDSEDDASTIIKPFVLDPLSNDTLVADISTLVLSYASASTFNLETASLYRDPYWATAFGFDPNFDIVRAVVKAPDAEVESIRLGCQLPFTACKDPRADPFSCPYAETLMPLEIVPSSIYVQDISQCDADMMGDGVCDPIYNVPACKYDGGDCCPFTCKSKGAPKSCQAFQCLDPAGLIDKQPPVLVGTRPSINASCTLDPANLTSLLTPPVVTAYDQGNASFSPVVMHTESRCIASYGDMAKTSVQGKWTSATDGGGNVATHVQDIAITSQAGLYTGCSINECSADGSVCTCQPTSPGSVRACFGPPNRASVVKLSINDTILGIGANAPAGPQQCMANALGALFNATYRFVECLVIDDGAAPTTSSDCKVSADGASLEFVVDSGRNDFITDPGSNGTDGDSGAGRFYSISFATSLPAGSCQHGDGFDEIIQGGLLIHIPVSSAFDEQDCVRVQAPQPSKRTLLWATSAGGPNANETTRWGDPGSVGRAVGRPQLRIAPDGKVSSAVGCRARASTSWRAEVKTPRHIELYYSQKPPLAEVAAVALVVTNVGKARPPLTAIEIKLEGGTTSSTGSTGGIGSNGTTGGGTNGTANDGWIPIWTAPAALHRKPPRAMKLTCPGMNEFPIDLLDCRNAGLRARAEAGARVVAVRVKPSQQRKVRQPDLLHLDAVALVQLA